MNKNIITKASLKLQIIKIQSGLEPYLSFISRKSSSSQLLRLYQMLHDLTHNKPFKHQLSLYIQLKNNRLLSSRSDTEQQEEEKKKPGFDTRAFCYICLQ
jgi:hypothetical protein